MLALAAPAPLRLRALLVVPAAIAALLVAALLVAGGSGSPASRASFRLSELAEGVTATDAAGRAVLLVRDGPEVTAFVPAIADVAGHDVVVDCPNGKWLASEIRGSIWTMEGDWHGGPAGRDLDRYPTTVRFDEVVVDTGTVIEGRGPRSSEPVLLPAGPAWDRAYEQATIRGFCPR